MHPWVIGVDLGGTKIRLGLVSPEDNIVATRQIPTNPHEGIDAVTTRIGSAVDELRGIGALWLPCSRIGYLQPRSGGP